MLLKKSGLKPWWALIPCAREYQLARCANLTVSSPGFKALAAQADVNGKRNATVSRMLKKMEDTEIVVEVSLGQILDSEEDDRQ